MYDYVRGQLAFADLKSAVIDCNGVGYKCFISENTYKKIFALETTKLYTYLNVREDVMELFGFFDEEERDCFLLLITISGVGPKAAISILSTFTCAELAAAIMRSDHKSITRANGIGPKTAQRICLELKDKLSVGGHDGEGETFTPVVSNEKDDAVEILVSLGYTRSDTVKAVDRCSADNTQDIVKQALRLLNSLK